MEEKQLDFNAPFLSVRRLSSDGNNKTKTEKTRPNRQHSLPIHKSDWELGEVTKPAAVPFQWEQIPGQAKDESRPYSRPPEEPSNTPRLPPGRLSGVLKRVSGEISEDKKAFRTQVEASQFSEHAALVESLARGINGNDESGLESEDDAYSDAFDTLSQLDSFSWNCSVSDLSGYGGVEEKPHGTFSADLKTRDFIMSRFLPAAKAMVLEMPQYVSRKQNVVTEPPPRPAKKFYSGELRPLRDQYGSNPISSYNKHVGDVESEDEDDGCDDIGKKKLGKTCGFFPRLCVKNSLFLLNPVPGMKSKDLVPGMKSRAQAPVASTGEVRRMARTAYSGPLPQTRDKHTSDAIYRKSSQLVVQTRERREAENKLTSKSNEFHHSSDSFTVDEPQGRSRGGRISPYRNEAPRSPFHDGARFLGVPKRAENLEGLEANNFGSLIKACDNFLSVSAQKMHKGSAPAGPVAEKTLYIDNYVNEVDTPNLNLGSSKAEGLKTLEGSGGAKSINTVGRRTTKPKAVGSLNADFPSSTSIPNLKSQVERIEGLKIDQDFEQEDRSLECLKTDHYGNMEMKNEDIIKADDQRHANVDSFQSSLPPLLPKSPSESWLWRTLPSISLRNPFSATNPHKQGQKTPKSGAKWETIVKTSNVHHDHVRYSEELVPHLSQHSKT